METTQAAQPELINFLQILEKIFPESPVMHFINEWEGIFFSLIAMAFMAVLVYFGVRNIKIIPGRVQAFFEMFVEGIGGFLQELIGPKGKELIPFVGTLFIYILIMNLMGMVPFLKAPSADWSVTMALAVIVYVYVQVFSIRQLGFIKYLDHLFGKPRGFMAMTILIPVMHLVTDLIRPITLSLRLRSNIWGDDLLLAVMTGFGISGLPLLFFSSLLTVVAAVIQAAVFCLLTVIYFALAMPEEEEHRIDEHSSKARVV